MGQKGHFRKLVHPKAGPAHHFLLKVREFHVSVSYVYL